MKKKIFCCILLFLSLFGFYMRPSIPVLGYHNIVLEKDEDIYSLTLNQFQEQMKYLYDHHYKTLTMDELYACLTGKKDIPFKSVVLTFDDGYASFIDLVKPILKQYHFHGTCFVIGKHVIDDKEIYVKEQQMINDETVSFYSHSYDLHQRQNGKALVKVLSLDEIEMDFDSGVVDSTYFAYPYGITRNMDTLLSKKQVKMAFSYNQFHNASSLDSIYAIPRFAMVDFLGMWYFRWVVL
ncbi:polysaccharide deacetylase family protein [Floccifex sp.]|uniref:polysaccharide deacetylase family protein n=1 Tax=Floccifex sp. TaxID=2815810 RepID=UPI003F058EBC